AGTPHLVVGGDVRREPGRADPGRDDGGVNAVRLHQLPLPQFADAQAAAGRHDRAVLAGDEVGVVEVVEVVDGTEERGDRPARNQDGQGVGADAVLGVVDVELGRVPFEEVDVR